MNLLCLAGSGADTASLAAALQRLDETTLRVVSTWDDFMQVVVANRPDAAVIDFSVLAQGGPGALQSAEWALQALRLPVLIAFSEADEELRHRIAIETDFEHFITGPFDPSRLARAIGRAAGISDWAPLNAAREVRQSSARSTVARQHGPTAIMAPITVPALRPAPPDQDAVTTIPGLVAVQDVPQPPVAQQPLPEEAPVQHGDVTPFSDGIEDDFGPGTSPGMRNVDRHPPSNEVDLRDPEVDFFHLDSSIISDVDQFLSRVVPRVSTRTPRKTSPRRWGLPRLRFRSTDRPPPSPPRRRR